MNVVTVESEVFNQIMDKFKFMEEKFLELNIKAQLPLSERWIDNQDAIELLKMSKRTLQTHRDEARLPYTQVGNKIYYKASDIEKMLKKNYQNIKGF